jgi:uncharacterized RDD family membrane protein YckC
MLDTVHAVRTPEGVDLSLRAAGPVARSLAWAVDSLLRGALLGALAMGLAAFGRLGMGLMMLATFAIWWFYPVVFEVNSRGQTPGKRALGLAVVHEDGTPIGWGASILRNFLRVVDFLPAFYLVGLAAMLIDSSFRRLGDLAAGTLVVYTETARSIAADVPEVAPLAPPVALDLEEQRAVIAFAERAPFLTPERAAELAAIPVPLHGDESAESRLVRMAAWLVGRHR